jgi:hypothetical protein
MNGVRNAVTVVIPYWEFNADKGCEVTNVTIRVVDPCPASPRSSRLSDHTPIAESCLGAIAFDESGSSACPIAQLGKCRDGQQKNEIKQGHGPLPHSYPPWGMMTRRTQVMAGRGTDIGESWNEQRRLYQRFHRDLRSFERIRCSLPFDWAGQPKGRTELTYLIRAAGL